MKNAGVKSKQRQILNSDQIWKFACLETSFILKNLNDLKKKEKKKEKTKQK